VQAVKLSDFRGKKNVIVAFYPARRRVHDQIRCFRCIRAPAPRVLQLSRPGWRGVHRKLVTQWQTLDGAGTIAAAIVVTLDTAGDRTLIDGEYTTIDATTKLPVKGWMHGELSAGGTVWSGAWWNAAPEEHGTFTFTLTGEKTFTGTYTQAQHGRKTFGWNGTRE
jgi:hypothetical protein